MGQTQTKKNGCGLKGGQVPERGEIQEIHQSKEAGTSYFTWISMALVLLQSKILFIIQIPACTLCARASAAMWPQKDKLQMRRLMMKGLWDHQG